MPLGKPLTPDALARRVRGALGRDRQEGRDGQET